MTKKPPFYKKKFFILSSLAITVALSFLAGFFLFLKRASAEGEAVSSALSTGSALSSQEEITTTALPTEGAQTSTTTTQTASSETSQTEPQTEPTVTEDIVKNQLDRMSLEEKVGQLFIARCPTENAAEKAADYHLGGYILFARDFEGKTKTQATQTISSYQDAVDIPLLIAVDEEGGKVTRISKYEAFRDQPFSSPQALFQAGGWDAIRADTEEKCAFLRDLGININFAPVCDVSEDPDDYIYPRTFGKDATQTARYIETVVQTMYDQKMGSVLKHFPGYGNNIDTHTGIAYDNRPYEAFESADFLPFRAGIANRASAVLVSHNVVTCMDDRYPASLSPRVHEILRTELGFQGVIISDELTMMGIRDFVGDEEAAVLAVQAGNDLICCTDFELQIPAVIQAVRDNRITVEQINRSVTRILEMKRSLGIL